MASTPKLLIILRHAKSAWPDVPDHERPLAPRGRRDAPRAGQWLRDAGRIPDRVLCSTARRARETWQLAASALGRSPVVTYDQRLYAAQLSDLLRAVAEVPNEVTTLLLVGHEPSVGELTLYLAGDEVGDTRRQAEIKFPTSAIAVLAMPGSWATPYEGCALLTDFVVPRG